MKRKRLIVIVTILVLIELVMVNLTYHSFLNKEVSKNSDLTRRKQFAIYVKDEKEENYRPYDGKTLFPIGYHLNIESSHCEDNKGAPVEGILSSVGNYVTVTSDKTVFCTLYFDESTATILTYDPAKSKSPCYDVQCALDDLYKLLR